MSVHDFWHGDIDLIYAYQKAYYSHLHDMAYIQGNYITDGVTIAYANAWSKGSKLDYGKVVKCRDVIAEENEKRLKRDTLHRKQKAEEMSRRVQEQYREWI